MTLAQEKAFKPGTPFQRRLAYDIPTRNVQKAEDAIKRLRKEYEKMTPDEQRQTQELLRKTWKTLISTVKDRRNYSAADRNNIWKIALMYTGLKHELARGKENDARK